MPGLREHFVEMAAEARRYDVAESAILVARRRRRLLRAAPVGVAVAAVLGVLAVWPPPGGGDQPPAVIADRSAISEVDAAGSAHWARLDWLPHRWSPPTGAPPLPRLSAPGMAALVYVRCSPGRLSCPPGTVLLTRHGRQYAVPDEVVGLSPDGRWLAYGPDGRQMLRDLTGTAVHALGNVSLVRWSPDSRWLAIEAYASTPGVNAGQVEVIDLSDWRRHTVPVFDPDRWGLVGVFPSGDLLLAPRGNTIPQGFELVVADARTGAQRHLEVSLRDQLARDEVIGSGPAMPLLIRRGDTLLYQLHRRHAGSMVPGDLVEIATDTGRVRKRYVLPDDGRELVGLAGGAALLRGRGGAAALERLDLVTGQRHVVAEPPVDTRLLIGGAPGWTT
jgi:hypothetical protein